MSNFIETINAIFEVLKYSFNFGREVISVITSSSLLMMAVILSALGVAVKKLK